MILGLSDRLLPHDQVVALGAGIREILGRVEPRPGDRETGRQGDKQSPSVSLSPDLPVSLSLGSYPTCCLEFERSAGWHRERAEEWVRKHLGLRDLGRTVHLQVLHRMQAGLRNCLRQLLSPGSATAGTGLNGDDSVPAELEFVPVPSLSREGERGRNSRAAASTPYVKGGAGLELDLADGRQRERVPPEHRPHLPGRGYVNYVEAQAIARRMAALHREHPANGQTTSVAVITFSPSQAALLRRLIQQDPLLADPHFLITVDVASAFRHREADLVLLSLTRSHTHRAVAFAPSPEELLLAITRARSRLIVFGDPGTLTRRLQWDGGVENLDPLAAARERDLLGRLCPHLAAPNAERHGSPVRQGPRA